MATATAISGDGAPNRCRALRPGGEPFGQYEQLRPDGGIVKGTQQGPVLFCETLGLDPQAPAEFLKFAQRRGIELHPVPR